jgi:DNA polymerase elongation subunit (family B)
LPKILQKLLSQRKATRKQAEKETDDFRKALLDAQQLAYKLTANSLYGQLGSNTSKIRRKCIAASTTGHGRQQLLFSKACIEAAYGPTAGDPRCSAVCVYGDTDSVFISFRPTDPVTGARLTGKAAQASAKALAEEAGQKISGALKPPHDFEFDKMFRCFCLLSKKRYFGDMTEGGLDDSDYHRKSMGIVMKRRDNAPIVKYVYGGVIERILNQRNIVAAFEFVRQAAQELLAGKFPMKRLTITKSLRAEYKLVPAHKILADRIGKRDPGNKPCSNDRIPFVYTMRPTGKPWSKDTSQGERIETPSYMKEKALKPDYTFYITNQIAKPVAQVFGLVVEKLPGAKKHKVVAATTPEAREKLATIYANQFQRIPLAIDQIRLLIDQPGQPPKRIVGWLNRIADLELRADTGVDAARSALEEIHARYPDSPWSEHATLRIATLRKAAKANTPTPTLKIGVYEQNIGLKRGSSEIPNPDPDAIRGY